MTSDSCLNVFRQPGALVIILGAIVASTLAAQRAQNTPSSAPMAVASFRGQYLQVHGATRKAAIAEDSQRVAFGADSLSADGKAAASFGIFAAGRSNSMPGYENPDRAIASQISRMGSLPVRFGPRQQLDRNAYECNYHNFKSEGMAFYQVMPVQNGADMIVLRTGYADVGYRKARGSEASAVARSTHCNVPAFRQRLIRQA